MPTNALEDVRSRIRPMRDAGRPPFEAILSPETWERLQALHLGHPPSRIGQRLTGVEVIGVRLRLVEGAKGVALKFDGGMNLQESP